MLFFYKVNCKPFGKSNLLSICRFWLYIKEFHETKQSFLPYVQFCSTIGLFRTDLCC